jgi:hypothetical protein
VVGEVREMVTAVALLLSPVARGLPSMAFAYGDAVEE